jgi:hypothetical protein
MDGDWFKAVDSWEKVLVFNQDRADLMQRLADVKKKLAERQREERIQVTMDLARANVQQGGFLWKLSKCWTKFCDWIPTNAEARIMLNDARRSAAKDYKSKMEGQVQEINQKAMDAFSHGRRKEALVLFNKRWKWTQKTDWRGIIKERILGLTPLSWSAERGGHQVGRAEFAEPRNFFRKRILLKPLKCWNAIWPMLPTI